MERHRIWRRGDAVMRGRGDMETRGRGDAGTRGYGDAGIWRRGDVQDEVVKGHSEGTQ